MSNEDKKEEVLAAFSSQNSQEASPDEDVLELVDLRKKGNSDKKSEREDEAQERDDFIKTFGSVALDEKNTASISSKDVDKILDDYSDLEDLLEEMEEEEKDKDKAPSIEMQSNFQEDEASEASRKDDSFVDRSVQDMLAESENEEVGEHSACLQQPQEEQIVTTESSFEEESVEGKKGLDETPSAKIESNFEEDQMREESKKEKGFLDINLHGTSAENEEEGEQVIDTSIQQEEKIPVPEVSFEEEIEGNEIGEEDEKNSREKLIESIKASLENIQNQEDSFEEIDEQEAEKKAEEQKVSSDFEVDNEKKPFISEEVKTGVLANLGTLVEAVKKEKEAEVVKSLSEDTIHRIAQPIITQWLEKNLNNIVQEIVQKEIQDLISKVQE